MMTKEGFTKIVNFMTPGVGVFVLGRGHINHTVKYIISLKIFFQLPGINQTNQACSNHDQGRVYQNCKFHNPWVGVLVLGRGHISHNETALFLLLSSSLFPGIDQINQVCL